MKRLGALAEQGSGDGHQDDRHEDLGEEDEPETVTIARRLGNTQATEGTEDADDHRDDAPDGLHAGHEDARDETNDHASQNAGDDA